MNGCIFTLFLGIALFLSANLEAQRKSAFFLRETREVLLLAGGTSLVVGGAYFYSNLHPSEEAHLNRQDIFAPDRFAVDCSNRGTAAASDMGVAMCIGLPLLATMCAGDWQSVNQDMILYAESVLLMQGMTLLSKAVFYRPRPYAYRLAELSRLPLPKRAEHSFFSNHAAAAFNGAVFAGTVFQRRYPESPWVKPIWIGGMTVATLTAIFRVTSGNHFPTDIVAGALVGSLTGWLIPYLHRSFPEEKGTAWIVGTGIGIAYHF